MRRRITMLVMAAMLALSMTFGGVAFAKQATSFERGCTTVHKGNSTNSQVDSQHRGGANSNNTKAC
jgi:hypothetical protein